MTFDRGRAAAALDAYRDADGIARQADAADAIALWLAEALDLLPDREHAVWLDPQQTAHVRTWLSAPNGGIFAGRACFEAVSGGGICVRTAPYRLPEA